MTRILHAAAATAGTAATVVLAAWCACLPFAFGWTLWLTVKHI